jgi:MFS family permease
MTRSKQISLFGLSIGFFWFSQYVYVPILPTYAREMGISYEMLGVILGSYGFTQMLLRIPLGIWSDTINKRRRFVVTGVAVSVASCLGMWLFPSEVGLLVFRALSGVAAATWVIHTVAFASLFQPDEATKAMGIVNAILNAGQVIAMFTGGLIAFHFGQEYTFLVAAAGGVVGIALSFAAPEPEDHTRPALTLTGLLSMAKQKNLAVASLLGFCIQVLTFGTVYGFTPIAARQIGASNFELGLMQTLFILPGVIASTLSGTYFATRYGERLSIVAGFVATAVAYTAIPSLTGIYGLYLSQALGGFARGVVYPLLMGLSIRDVAGHQRGSAMGVFQAVYGFGMFLGPVMVGMVSDRAGLAWGFWLIGGFAIASAAIAAWQLPRQRRLV